MTYEEYVTERNFHLNYYPLLKKSRCICSNCRKDIFICYEGTRDIDFITYMDLSAGYLFFVPLQEEVKVIENLRIGGYLDNIEATRILIKIADIVPTYINKQYRWVYKLLGVE